KLGPSRERRKSLYYEISSYVPKCPRFRTLAICPVFRCCRRSYPAVHPGCPTWTEADSTLECAPALRYGDFLAIFQKRFRSGRSETDHDRADYNYSCCCGTKSWSDLGEFHRRLQFLPVFR